MHGKDHLIASGVTINLRHPCPHHMHNAENNAVFNLASFQTSKHFVNSIGFDGTLIGKNVAEASVGREPSNYAHCSRWYYLPHPQKNVTPASNIVANVQ